MFAQCVYECGVSQDDVATMIRTNPAAAARHLRRSDAPPRSRPGPRPARGDRDAVSDPVRIGLIVPSSNTVMEVDLYRRLPAGPRPHRAHVHGGDHARGRGGMLDRTPCRRPGTSGRRGPMWSCSAARAPGHARRRLRRACAKIAEATGAVASAHRLGPRGHRAARGGAYRRHHPYVDALNEKIRASIEADGVEVAASTAWASTRTSPSQRCRPTIVDLASRASRGTNRPAVRVLHQLPAVDASNGSNARWACPRSRATRRSSRQSPIASGPPPDVRELGGRRSADVMGRGRRALAGRRRTAKAIAGGQSLIPMMSLRLATPWLLVDI